MSKIEDTSAWRPGTTQSTLRARAHLLQRLRRFFAERDVLEVETPLLGRCFGNDPALEPFTTYFSGAPGRTLYLQSSPEFCMKRLLAAESGPIYQVCKAFRNGELGQRHNPEFTLLEWYRPGYTLDQLMAEVVALLHCLLEDTTVSVQEYTYAGLMADRLQLDIFSADVAALRACAVAQQVPDAATLPLDKDAWLDLLMSVCIEPTLEPQQLSFITAYPASQAALAELNTHDPRTAARFELYYQGLELANGFQELTDAAQQTERLRQDNQRRLHSGQTVLPLDAAFLAALEHGLPACAGVAVGLDRVLMGLLGVTTIDQVQTFAVG